MVFARPASDRISVLQTARFVLLTGPAADEILELHSVRLMVFAGPASDQIFVLQIAKFVVLTGPAADVLQIAKFEDLTGLLRMKFWSSILQGSWSLLGLPVTEFSYCRLPGSWS